MKQVRIIYSSASTTLFDDYYLADLALKSATANKALNVTGFLIYKNKFFFQFLEGHSTELIPLIKKIHLDSRHQILKQQVLEEADEKVFPEWSMEYINSEDLNGKITVAKKRFIVDCWSLLLPQELLT